MSDSSSSSNNNNNKKPPLLFYKKDKVPVELISDVGNGKFLVAGPEHAIVDNKEKFTEISGG